MLPRERISHLCEQEVLETAARLSGTSKDRLGKFDDYEGCVNLVYHYEIEDQPRILRLVQMQELMHFAQYLDDPDNEIQAELRYKIHCIENDIPYLGFFDTIFDPKHPFALEA